MDKLGTGIDTEVPHSARIWNYWLGGKDHYEVDRQVGEEIKRVYPGIVRQARESRYFLARAVRHLVRVGVDQFLDVGTGLPTVDNTHEVAQRANPQARVVYVDNDPLVLSHARALLTSQGAGVTKYIDADLREPSQIIAQARNVLDFTKPVGLMLLSVLPHIADDEEARQIVSDFMEALPGKSFLVIAHDTADYQTKEITEAARYFQEQGGPPIRLRSREQIEEFYDGMAVIEPGVIMAPFWRPEVTWDKTAGEVADLGPVPLYAAVGQKR